MVWTCVNAPLSFLERSHPGQSAVVIYGTRKICGGVGGLDKCGRCLRGMPAWFWSELTKANVLRSSWGRTRGICGVVWTCVNVPLSSLGRTDPGQSAEVIYGTRGITGLIWTSVNVARVVSAGHVTSFRTCNTSLDEWCY